MSFHERRLDAPLRRLRQIILFILEPSAKVQDVDIRRRGRLLSGIVFILIPPLLSASQWEWIDPRFSTFLQIGLVCMGVAYLLNRVGYYRAAATLLLGWLLIVPYYGVVTQEKGGVFGVSGILIFTILPIMTAYLLFAPRVVVLVFIANMLCIVLGPLLVFNLPLQPTLFSIFFVLVVSMLILIAGVLRQYDQQQLTRQSFALAESEARYRQLFEAAFEAIIVHDDGLVLDANPAFEQITGYSLAEAKGTPLVDFVSPDFRGTFKRKLASVPSEPFETVYVCKNGTSIQVEIRGKEHPYMGRIVRVAAVRDITERKQAETEHLVLTVEREKMKMMQRFMGTMSHDLRTPLTVMKTGIYLLKRLINDPEKRDHQIEILEAQTDHMQHLMDNMLNMARLDRATDTGKFDLKLVDANDAVRDVIEEHRTLAQRKNQTLEFIAGTQTAKLLIDVEQFNRMLRHLLLNALNYTPAGGTIRVDTESQPPNLLIRVQDSGIGIDSEDMPHIFEHFYRADDARNSDKGGTGLGLTIAKKIAEAHGGAIEVDSVLGQGSTFTILLPLVNDFRKDPPKQAALFTQE
jgi:PAS domain S-box-containing protein